MPRLLVLNGGSTSTKFALFDADDLTEIRRGHSGDVNDLLSEDLVAIGHRIVHGGKAHRAPEALTPDVLEALRAACPLAPDHLPGELDLINFCRFRLPHVPQFGCYDTWFHRTLPRVARLFALPRQFAETDGILRYGFHGVSYEWIVGRLGRLRDDFCGRAVVAHLGGGASLAALNRGVSIDTTMGFTPAGGLVMGTRPGDLDPGILLYLLNRSGMTLERLEQVLQKESGLAGLSGGISDMRRLLSEADQSPAAEAVAIFAVVLPRGIAAMATSLGGFDTLVFTGGIGEHMPTIRQRICDDLRWLGAMINPNANTNNAARIDGERSLIEIHVIATDEERQIAKHVSALLKEMTP